MTSDKICFICGTRHDIGKHHIIPKAIVGNRFVPNNTMPVCDHCHKGIHEGGGFLPNTKGWKKLRSPVGRAKEMYQLEAIQKEVIHNYIIQRVETIQQYKNWLDFKKWCDHV